MKKAAKEKELALKEQELQRLKEKNEDDRKRKESMAGQTRFYGDALKHSLPKMGNDPSEFPSYCRAVEICLLCTRYLSSYSRNFLFLCLTSVVKAC